MANSIKTSELEETESLNSSDLFMIVQNNENKKILLSNLLDVFYPIGSLLVTTKNNDKLLGVWEVLGEYGQYEINVYNQVTSIFAVCQCEYGDYPLYLLKRVG